MPDLRSPLICISLALAAGCAADPPMTSEATTTTGEGGPASATEAEESSTTAALDCDVAANELYTRRIAPILASDRPKTCNTCHLAGVDVQLFLQETPCQTMACLDARGLVDLAAPTESLLLQWISRADPASPLIDQQVIDEEYAAFLAWIEVSAACGLCYAGEAACGGAAAVGCAEEAPEEPYVDPGGCDAVVLEELFQRRVYAWRDRCSPCHFDDQKIDAPKWIATGPCDLASLKTMHAVVNGGLVNRTDPTQSLLLVKPLAEAAGGIEHGGHDKFADASDAAYVDFLSWITREAACAEMN
jgi:hypothetical protein